MSEDVEILTAALLWLRNHYELDGRTEAQRVIDTIDRVLARFEPTMAGQIKFRTDFLTTHESAARDAKGKTG